MRTTIRNAIAVILLIVAAVLTGAGALGAKAAGLIDTPGPLQRILGPLASDPDLRQVLPERLGEELSRRLTEEGTVPQLVAGPLREAIATSSAALLDDPGFRTAWEASIEASRVDFTSRLDAAAGTPGAGQVTARLDIAPLLGAGYNALHTSVQGSVLGNLLPASIQSPPMFLDTGWPQADQLATDTLNSWLALARGWGWMVAGALVAAVAGMLLATGTGRPWALLAGGATALAMGSAARLWFGSLGTGTGAAGNGTGPGAAPEIESLVTDGLLESLAGEFGPASNILLGCGIAAMLAGAAWAWRKTHRAGAAAEAPPRG